MLDILMFTLCNWRFLLLNQDIDYSLFIILINVYFEAKPKSTLQFLTQEMLGSLLMLTELHLYSSK